MGLARSLYSAAGGTPDLTAEAVAEYERAVALSPNFWQAWLELSAAYGAAGRMGDGVTALERAAELLKKQAQITREDPDTLREFAAAHILLGLEPGTYYP